MCPKCLEVLSWEDRKVLIQIVFPHPQCKQWNPSLVSIFVLVLFGGFNIAALKTYIIIMLTNEFQTGYELCFEPNIMINILRREKSI